MKTLFPLFLLLSLSPAFSATENAGEPANEEIVMETASEAPVIALWRTTLSNALKRVTDNSPDFPPDELQEMKYAINGAISALDKLYRARLLYGYTCISEAFEAHVPDEEAANKMRMEWKKLLDECAERDLQAVFLRVLWVESEDCSCPPTHNMHIAMPRQIRAFRNRSCGGNDQVCLRASLARDSMQEMVDAFSKSVLRAYTGSHEILAMCDHEILTGFPKEGMLDTNVSALFAKLQTLYADAEKCWQEYCGKVEALVSPCHSFSGSGTSELADDLVCHLLNSRDIYLSHIATGILNDPFWEWEIEDIP